LWPVALILIVLLQAGKGAGIGAAFGGASQTVFGPRGPGNFLSKLTTAAAGIFMVTSLVLAIFSSQYIGGSVIMSAPVPRPAAAPTTTPSGGEQTAPNVQAHQRAPGRLRLLLHRMKGQRSRKSSNRQLQGVSEHTAVTVVRAMPRIPFQAEWWNLVDTPS